MNHRTIIEFSNAQDARDYRHTHGTGGWIFVPENGLVVLFPPCMPPAHIFKHPITRGRTGELIGAA